VYKRQAKEGEVMTALCVNPFMEHVLWLARCYCILNEYVLISHN